MKLLALLASIILLGLSQAFAQKSNLPADDKDYGCMTQQQANKYIKDFNIDVSSFGGVELCNATVDTKKLFNDLQIIEGGRFAPQGKNLLIKDFIHPDQYYTWMMSMTQGISRGNDIPFATAYNSGGYFTMQDGWAILSTLGRVGTVVHEARHTGGYYHIQCTFGPYAQSSIQGCDRDYTYGGSHAIEMEYYARVSVQGTNFHPVYKSMARLMAMGRSNFVFNKSPIQKRSALIAINEHAEGIMLLNNQLKNLEVNHPDLKLKRTSFGATLFDGLKAFAIDIYQNTGFQLNVMDDYSYYKLLRQDRGQGSEPMKDVEEVDMGAKRYFMFLNSKNQVATYLFPKGALSKYSQAPQNSARFETTLPDGSQGLYLISDNQEVYAVNPENLQIKKNPGLYPNGIATAVSFDQGTLILNHQGDVLLQSGKEMQRFQPLENMKIRQLISAPVYDAFEVNQ